VATLPGADHRSSASCSQLPACGMDTHQPHLAVLTRGGVFLALLPGVSVYVLDGFNTTQTVVANLNANGTYPVCMIRWAPQSLCSGVQLLCTCAPSKRHIPENALAVQADATPGDELCSIATGQHILQLQSTDSTSLHAAGLAPLRPGLRIKQTLRPVATPLWVSLGASG
jgi:hypothetical protein